MFLIALCSFCVFIWISLVPARGFFGCSWHSWFSLISFHILLFQCVLVLLQILTTWYLSCACLGLFKIISLLDLRVYFIIFSTYHMRWECVRLEYLYISCCCNIFSTSSEVHAFPVAGKQLQWKRWVSGRACQVLLFSYSCTVVLQSILERLDQGHLITILVFFIFFPLYFVFSNQLF